MPLPRPLLGFFLAALAAIVLANAAATPADTTGLVLAYGFEETSGTSATDSSGSGNTGTLAGPVSTVSGRFGRALSFDGVNDVVNVADSNSLDLTTAMTLEAWVKPEGTGWQTALLKERSGGLEYALYASTDTGPPSGEVRTGTSAETRGSAALPLAVWSHVAATYDGSTLRLFVNGAQVATRATSGSIEVGTGALRIGGNLIWGEYCKGTIDEVRVYRRALTAGEIQTDMNTAIVASDTQPPTAPGSLAATVTGDDVHLGWNASSDNVGVTGYRIYRSSAAGFTPDPGTLIAAPGTATAYDDLNRPNGAYYYKVIAVDAVGNPSAASAEAQATVNAPDTQAPTAPGSLAATVAGNDVHLTWNPSTDNVGVNGYRVYRSSSPGYIPGPGYLVAAVGGGATSYVDAGVIPGSFYYKVVAVDAAGNAGAPSAEVKATVVNIDTTPPSAPSNVMATVTGDLVQLSWTASTDNQGVYRYRIFRDTTPGFSTCCSYLTYVVGSSTTYFDDVNQPSGTFYYKVIAEDLAGNQSAPSNEVSATLEPDTIPPTVAFVEACDGVTPVKEYFDVHYSVVEDRGGLDFTMEVEGHVIWHFVSGGASSGGVGRLEWTTRNSWLTNGLHTMTIVVRDSGGHLAGAQCLWNVQNPVLTIPITSAADGTTVSGNVLFAAEPRVDGQPITTFPLQAAELEVDGVRVFGNARTPIQTSWDSTKVANGVHTLTALMYWLDYGGPMATSTIQVTVDNPVPQPLAVTATVAQDDVHVAWSAPPPVAGVTGYRIHRSTAAGFTPDVGTLIATLGSVSAYDDLDRPPGTYYYKVVAVDALGALSAPSLQVQATVTAPDTQSPSAPGSLTANVTADDVHLAWNASNDDVGVTGYRVHRSTTAGFTPADANRIGTTAGATSYDDLDRPAGTYYYRVVAVDGAGNTSTPSTEVSATVQPPPTGLVAAYGFEETSGTTVNDSSGSANTGTISGAIRATGKYGSSLSFDGVNDLVTIADANSLDLTIGMTLEAWVRPSAITGWRTAMFKQRPGGFAYALYSGTDTGRPGAFVDIGGEKNAQATAQLPLNTWTHLAMTYDGAGLRLYVNGALVSSQPVTGALPITTGQLTIGGNTVWSEWFKGSIDEVRVYNRALTGAEIVADRDRPVVSGT